MDDDGGRDATLTCFHTLLLEVRAAAEVVLTVAVTPASRRLHLLQLEAPPLAGASGSVPLRADWKRGEGRVSKNKQQGDASHVDSGASLLEPPPAVPVFGLSCCRSEPPVRSPNHGSSCLFQQQLIVIRLP